MAKRSVARVVPGVVILLVVLAFCFALAAFQALYPQADETLVFENSGTTLDASHTDQGYVMVRHEKTKKKLKMRVVLDDATYVYDLSGNNEYQTIPLTFGDGSYEFQVYRQVSGKRYTLETSLNVPVELTDDTLPFLYPNQFVWYTPESEAVEKASELCQGLTTAGECLAAVDNFVTENIVYDNKLAKTVQSGYIPDVDQVLDDGKGICFGYSCLTACMLRTQGVPTKLVIGYADESYHAWNSVLIDGEWVLVDTTAEANGWDVTSYTEERIY